MLYDSVNIQVLAHVPPTAARILDVGCGTGALGREIKKRLACSITGITHSVEEAKLAASNLDCVIVRDLNEFDPGGLGEFDCIICSHVLEHLHRPEKLLGRLGRHFSPDGLLIVALPNVLHWRQRAEFCRGRFRYTPSGLMDETHYRFFDWTTAHALLTDSGYSTVESRADGGFPFSRRLSVFGPPLDRVALRLAPGVFGFQFILVARSSTPRQ